MRELGDRIATYLACRWPQATEVAVEEIERIFGGASRETYRVAVRLREGEARVQRRLILRRDPTSSLIETDRATEFHAYAAFYGSSVPVPRPLFVETDCRWLDRPFFVMEEVVGAVSTPKLLSEPPYVEVLESIGEQKWRILGTIARTDVSTIGLAKTLEVPALEDCWRRELDFWEKVIDDDELTPSLSPARRSGGCDAILLHLRGAFRSFMGTTVRGISSSTVQAASAPFSTGKCVISATLWRTSPGRLIRCGAGPTASGRESSCLGRGR